MAGSDPLPGADKAGMTVNRGRITDTLREGLPGAWIQRLYLIALGLAVFLFPFGLVFVAGGLLPPQYSWTASVIIILNAIVTLLSEFRAVAPRRALLLFALLTALLFVIEYVGVTTGYPFGIYEYTATLGGLVVGVPMAIPLAWYTTVINAWRIGNALAPASAAGAMMVAGLLTLAMDVALEPMASAVTGYWLWDGGTVPVQNYISWVGFVMLSSILLKRFYDRAARHSRPLLLGAAIVSGSQYFLFALTDAMHGHLVAMALSLLILSIVGVHAVRQSARGREGGSV